MTMRFSPTGVTIVALVSLVACERRDEAYVECRNAGVTLSSGMACSIEHRSGTRPLHACWQMNVTCVNGTAGSAHGCGDVEPRSKASVLMPYSAFGLSLERCDRVATATVTGVALAPR